jgi:hypothetical protein
MRDFGVHEIAIAVGAACSGIARDASYGSPMADHDWCSTASDQSNDRTS